MRKWGNVDNMHAAYEKNSKLLYPQVGTFIMGPLSKILIEKFEWKFALLIQGGMILMCAIFALAYRPIEPTVVSELKKEEEMQEKKSLMGEMPHSPAFTKPLPEGRFAYSVPNSSHNTWMGTANNTSYPTAAEIFRQVLKTCQCSSLNYLKIIFLQRKWSQFRAKTVSELGQADTHEFHVDNKEARTN